MKYHEKKEVAIDEIVYTIEATFKAMEREQTEGFKADRYLSCYSVNFISEGTAEGKRFIMKDHTAETRIYYALI